MLEGLLTEIFDEIMDSGAPIEGFEAWMLHCGAIFTWCGTGDASILPPHIRDYIYKNRRDLLAIEAPKAG